MPVAHGSIRDAFRSRAELLTENALLRQQLIVASRQVKRPPFRPYERGIVVALSSILEHWRNAVLVVKPETVLRWHREGFRLIWKQRSRSTKKREPRVARETILLIRQMAAENCTYVKPPVMWSGQ